MLIFVLPLAVILVVVALDLAVKRVYRYPKKTHESTPADFAIPFEEVHFPTRNNRRLYGWWMPARGNSRDGAPALLLVHGWGRNLERTTPYVRALHPLGYSLLAFDLRSHGSSDRESYPNMLKFSQDIRAAVDYLMSRSPEYPASIGVVGLSVGGAAAIHAAAKDARIRAVVGVGALAHPADVMRFEFSRRGLPYVPAGWLMLQYLELRMRVSFDRIAPEAVIRSAAAQILLIHGEHDAVVPLDHGKRLQRAGRPHSTRLWIVPGKAHSDCHDHPEFWDRVASFLQETVPIVDL